MRKDWPSTSAGAASTGCGELAFDVVEDAAQLDDLVADLAFGRVVADQLADLGEQRLGVDRQGVVDDPQRDLDQLEVVEVAVLGRLRTPGRTRPCLISASVWSIDARTSCTFLIASARETEVSLAACAGVAPTRLLRLPAR